MFFGHSWGDLPMICTHDFVTRENHRQITSLVTKKSLFTVTHALFFISWFPLFKTLWGWVKMATTLAHNILEYISMNEKFLVLNRISLKYVISGLIDNMAALV